MFYQVCPSVFHLSVIHFSFFSIYLYLSSVLIILHSFLQLSLPPLSHSLFLFTSYLHQFSHHTFYVFSSPIRSMSNNSSQTTQSSFTTLHWIIIAKYPSLWFLHLLHMGSYYSPPETQPHDRIGQSKMRHITWS